MQVNLFDDTYFGIGKIEHPREYFESRDISIDCRGGPIYISKGSRWGLHIQTYTMSHHVIRFTEPTYRPLSVHAGAWICGNVLLYNCTIGKEAIVSCGSVVSGRDVPPWTMVEGNPARIIARFDGTQWVYLESSESLPRTQR